MSRSDLRRLLFEAAFLGVLGAGVGSALGFAAPPTAARARSGCKCSANIAVSSHYDCASSDASGCTAGTIACSVQCPK